MIPTPPLKRWLARIWTPDELDMEEHYPTRAERLADLWVHVGALVLAAIGGVMLAVISAVGGGGPGLVVATAVYALCLIAMLTCSTIYNLTHPSAVRPVLRRLDEAAIFLMIAGSYTPFTTQRFEGAWSVGFTLLIWVFALSGVVAKLFLPRLSDKLWSAVYVAFGWLAVLAIQPMMAGVPPLALGLLVAGGLIYTLGVFVFISPAVPYRRAIWHGFVVAGAGAHYAAVLLGVVLVA